MLCQHGIAGHCPICATDRRADIAERELRETAEELERVRLQLEEVRRQRDTDAETCEEAVRSAEESLERLREATGLLRECRSNPDAAWWERRGAFLSGAPAREARTNALLCYEGDCAKMTGRARPCPIHDGAGAAPRTPVLRPEFIALGEALGMGRPAQDSEDQELSRIDELEHELRAERDSRLHAIKQAVRFALEEERAESYGNTTQRAEAAEAAADAAGCEWRKAEARAESAEAKLAAVRDIVNGRFTHGQMVLRIRALLRTPAPATGEKEGT